MPITVQPKNRSSSTATAKQVPKSVWLILKAHIELYQF